MGESVVKLLTIDEKTLKKLQSFSTIQEMNKALKLHQSKHDLSKTDRAILHILSRYACKFIGVCYLRKQRIAEAAGFKSRRTAIRACQRLEALGIIKQYETRRQKKDRRQAPNIIVLQPFSDEKKPWNNAKISNHQPSKSHRTVTPASHIKKPQQKPLTKLKQHETYIETDTIIKRGLKHSIPKPFYEAFAPFFDGQTMYDIYGLLLRAKAKVDRYIVLEDYADTYIDAFYNVLRLYKLQKIKSFKGYLYTTWERLSAEISRQRYDKIQDFLSNR